MTISITSDEVEEIIETDVTIDLTSFITAAVAIVQKNCADLNPAYTDDELNLIAIWLSAHVYATRDPRPVVESLGNRLSVTNQSKVDLYFCNSHYGQMALLLDWYGGLAKLQDKMKNQAGGLRTIGITWLGEEEKELEE